MARRPLSVRLSVCKLLRKSFLLAGKWLDRHQTYTWWSPGEPASRVCSRSRSRAKVTWYAHFFGFLEWATPSLTVWPYDIVLQLIGPSTGHTAVHWPRHHATSPFASCSSRIQSRCLKNRCVFCQLTFRQYKLHIIYSHRACGVFF